jgi:hypothetical protein
MIGCASNAYGKHKRLIPSRKYVAICVGYVLNSTVGILVYICKSLIT